MKTSQPPVSVTIVAMLVLSLTIINTIRAGAAITRWGILREFEPHPGPLYILLTGLAWAVTGGVMFIALGRRRAWARTGLSAAAALYCAYVWADRLIFQAGQPRANVPFSVTITIVGLACVLFVLWSPAGRNFLDKREGHD